MAKAKKVFLALAIMLMISGLVGCVGDNGGYSKTITVYNWGDYIDESVIKEFENEYGINVIYEMFTTNEEMYIKLKAGGGKYDVLFPSDYMISRLINEDMLCKIDMGKITNYEYIDEGFKNLDYDSNNEYSIPYMWGTLGILYNKTMVNETVDSWDILWDSKYGKNIFMLDSQRDSIAVALKRLGYSLNSRDKSELEEAKQELIAQKPLILSYVGDEVKDKMISGEAALTVAWSGDAVYMMEQNADLAYTIPEEGSNLWFDAMCIPKSSENKEEAELFINFMTDPEISLKNAEYIGYSTPNTVTKDMLNEDVRNNKTAYPSDGILDNLEVFENVSDVIELYNRIWDEVKAAN